MELLAIKDVEEQTAGDIAAAKAKALCVGFFTSDNSTATLLSLLCVCCWQLCNVSSGYAGTAWERQGILPWNLRALGMSEAGKAASGVALAMVRVKAALGDPCHLRSRVLSVRMASDTDFRSLSHTCMTVLSTSEQAVLNQCHTTQLFAAFRAFTASGSVPRQPGPFFFEQENSFSGGTAESMYSCSFALSS